MKRTTLIFLFSILLIKLPPFYFLPVTSQLFTSHIAAKFILFSVALYLIKNRINKIQKSKIFIFLLIYFFSQSISIISAENIFLALKDYQNLISNTFIFLNSFLLIQYNGNKTNFLKFIIFTGLFVSLLEFIFFIFPQQFLSLGDIFIQKEVIETYIFDVKRGRYNLYLQNEIFLPFFIYFLVKDIPFTKIQSFLKLLFIPITLFLSVISNFRRRFLLAIISSILSVTFYHLKRPKLSSFINKPNLIIIVITIIFALTGSLFLIKKYKSYDVVDRILLLENQDVGTIVYRIDSFKTSLQLFLSSPLTGAGLGNYQIYVSNYNKSINLDKISSNYIQRARSDPHSIISKTLAETGILGITGFLLLIFIFLKKDVLFLKYFYNHQLLPYIISFWLLFLYSLFSPFTTVFRAGWFWFLRGIIEGIYNQKYPRVG